MGTIRVSRGWFAVRNAAEANVAVGEHEPRLLVVLLLGNDAVEADDAMVKPRHSRLPKSEAVPSPAQPGLDDVESQERESGLIRHHRDARDQLAVEPADEEACGVGGIKTIGVGETGIPPLLRRPLDHEIEVGARGGADLEWRSLGHLSDVSA